MRQCLPRLLALQMRVRRMIHWGWALVTGLLGIGIGATIGFTIAVHFTRTHRRTK